MQDNDIFDSGNADNAAWRLAAAGEAEKGGGHVNPAGDDGGDWDSDGINAAGDAWDDVTPGDGVNEDAAATATDERFRLKHLGRELAVTRDEVIALAQKGRDYDRIRTRADSLAGALAEREELAAFTRELAADEGLTPEELIDRRRAADLAKREGVEFKKAEERVRAARDARPEHAKRRAVVRREREVDEFFAEYGSDFDPAAIPAAVWGEVRTGKPLLMAFQGHENRTLRDKITADAQGAQNSARSAGSRATDGASAAEEIDIDWRR